MESSRTDDDKKVRPQEDVEGQDAIRDDVSIGKGDILQLEHTDPVLNAKMHLVNNAIGNPLPLPLALIHLPPSNPLPGTY